MWLDDSKSIPVIRPRLLEKCFGSQDHGASKG
jgi:hypothetical protein